MQFHLLWHSSEVTDYVPQLKSVPILWHVNVFDNKGLLRPNINSFCVSVFVCEWCNVGLFFPEPIKWKFSGEREINIFEFESQCISLMTFWVEYKIYFLPKLWFFQNCVILLSQQMIKELIKKGKNVLMISLIINHDRSRSGLT